MFKTIDKNIKNIHLIGIGGVSMSAIAKYLFLEGYHVSGSDKNTSEVTDALKKIGIDVQQGHDANFIKNADLVIYSAAINDSTDEMIYAKEHNIPLLKRSKFMNLLTTHFKDSIAVTGTHGKTTTTSMLASMFFASPLEPTIFIGADLDLLHGNFQKGKDDIIINETCEYQNAHHDFDANYAIINNIELDHTDFYADLDAIKDSFVTFCNKLRENAIIAINLDDANAKDILPKIVRETISYGIKQEADYMAKNIQITEKHFSVFDLYKNGAFYNKITLSVPGHYNIYNALAALVIVDQFKLLNDQTIDALKSFGGTHRRFEYKGKINDTLVYVDYAHHPTAIKNLIEAIEEFYPKKNIHMIFQPHTYSRTHSLFNQFIHSFSGVKKLYLVDIYAAREQNLSGVNSKALAKAINENQPICEYYPQEQPLLNEIKTLTEDDILFIVGAGDIIHILDHFDLNDKPSA